MQLETVGETDAKALELREKDISEAPGKWEMAGCRGATGVA
jgi:hypothetical protein